MTDFIVRIEKAFWAVMVFHAGDNLRRLKDLQSRTFLRMNKLRKKIEAIEKEIERKRSRQLNLLDDD